MYWWNISLFSFFSLIWFPFFFSLHLISIFRVFRSQFILTEHITVRNYLFLRTLHIGYFDQDVKIIRLIYMYNTLKYTAHIQITDILSYTHTCIRMHTLNIKRPKTNRVITTVFSMICLIISLIINFTLVFIEIQSSHFFAM